MKATQLLKRDHAAIKKLFLEFGKIPQRAVIRREQCLGRIVKLLQIHSAIEEEIFYPAMNDASAEGRELVIEAITAHNKVDDRAAEVQMIDMASDDAAVKVESLKDLVLHHATGEERDMFPLAERVLPDGLRALGERMQRRENALARLPAPRVKAAFKRPSRRAA